MPSATNRGGHRHRILADASLIALVIVAAVGAVGTNISARYDNVSTAVDAAVTGALNPPLGDPDPPVSPLPDDGGPGPQTQPPPIVTYPDPPGDGAPATPAALLASRVAMKVEMGG